MTDDLRLQAAFDAAPEYRLDPLANGRMRLFRKILQWSGDQTIAYEHVHDCTGQEHAKTVIQQMRRDAIYLDADGNVVDGVSA